MVDAYVNKKTLIGEIVKKYPDAVEELFCFGMHCLGCSAAQGETLEDACAVHGLDSADVVRAVNQRIAIS